MTQLFFNMIEMFWRFITLKAQIPPDSNIALILELAYQPTFDMKMRGDRLT